MSSGVPLVSYVLVNWHTEELLPRALASVDAQSYAQREVILVNNGSASFDPTVLAHYPDMKLLSNNRNLGFAGANNQAINASHGDYIVLLNCDAYLDPDFTRRALAVIAANEQIGTVVPKILRDDQSGVIDSAGHIMYEDRTAAHRGRGEHDQGQYDGGGFVFGGTAAAIVYRRAMLEQLARSGGGRRRTPAPEAATAVGEVFDETFFAYFEDVDLDWRALLAGWRAYYEPRCVAWHRGHGSGGRASYAIRLRAEKNRYLMLAKNDTLAGQLGCILPLALYESWHALRTLFTPWLWPAYLMLLWYLPRTLACRWAAGRQCTLSHNAVTAFLLPRGLQPPLKAEPPAAELFPETVADATAGQFPLVSVVILNYNGLALSRACVASLTEQSYEPLELILVDNGSAVDEAQLLAMEFPELHVLRLEHNHGFSGGVNWGLTLVHGDYFVLVNNDCVCHADCIRNLVYAARRTKAPAVSGRLVDIARLEQAEPALVALEAEFEQAVGERIAGEASPDIVQALADSWRNDGRSIGLWHVHNAYAGRDECFDPSGGLCLLERGAVADMLPQLFPHFYFAYGEDLCLGIRLRGRGGWVAKEPRAAAVHMKHGTARLLNSGRVRYMQERNRALNILGFYPAWVLIRLAPLLVLQTLAVAVINLLKRPLHFAGWLAAQLWLLTHPCWLARWRRHCRSQLTVPDERWLSELSGRLGSGGNPLSKFSLWWCRVARIPHREARGSGEAAGDSIDGQQ